MIVSRASDVSLLVHGTVERAVAMNITVVPLRIDDVQVSKALAYLLTGIKWHDARPDQSEEQCDDWVRTVQSLLQSRCAEVHRRRVRVILYAVLLTCGIAATVWSYIALQDRIHALVAVTNPGRARMVIDLGYVLGIFEAGRRVHLKDLEFSRKPAKALILALGLKVDNVEEEPRLLQVVAAKLEEEYELRCLAVGTDLAKLQITTVATRTMGASPKLGKELADEATGSVEDNLRTMGMIPSAALPAGTVAKLRDALERGPGTGDDELSHFKAQMVRAMREANSTERSLRNE